MARRIVWFGLPLLLAGAGCVPPDTSTLLVASNPFATDPVPPPNQVASASPATNEAATRVGLVGQKLVAANPQLGVRPLFRTLAVAQAEVFHRNTTEVLITEGLVKQCSEGQLAGVLAVELGKMVSEREAQATVKEQVPDRDPPPPLFIGADNTSTRGPADMTHLAELAPYERQRRQAAGTLPATPPDPQVLGHGILLKAGYSAADLQAAEPVLKLAAQNVALERQFNLSSAAHSWVR
jgi:hypothetical protein